MHAYCNLQQVIQMLMMQKHTDLKPGVGGVAGLAVAPAHVEVALYLHGCTDGQVVSLVRLSLLKPVYSR